MSKYALIALGAAVALLTFRACEYHAALEAARVQARQVEGFLSEKERELVALRAAAGASESTLRAKVGELESEAARLRQLYGDTSAEYAAFRDRHDIEIRQLQRATFSLRQRISDLESDAPAVVVTSPSPDAACAPGAAVAYSYTDGLGRVSFKTPNCLAVGGESVELSQRFVVYGEVHQQREGALRVSNLYLHEVSPQDPTRVLSTAQMVSGEFKYFAAPAPSAPQQKQFHVTVGLGVTSAEATALAVGFVPLTWRSYYIGVNALYTDAAAGSSVTLGVRPQPFSAELNLGAAIGVGATLPQMTPVLTLQLDFFIW
jgi:hypothetical protein